MDGHLPVRLWDSKIGLSPPAPLDVLLGFLANKTLANPHEDYGEDLNVETLGFALASLLTNYNVIFGYSYADFISVLREQLDQLQLESVDELMADFNEFVFERGPDEPMVAVLFALFEDIAEKIQESDDAASLPKEYNSEFLSIIRSYVRRIHVAFMSMSFEQVCDLATEFEMYSNGATPVVHDSMAIEENIEKTMADLQAGIRDKDRLLDELEAQCDQMRQVSQSSTSRLLLQADAVIAEQKLDEWTAVEKTYELSDIPESRLNARIGIEREHASGTDTSMETITEAALNVALCQARLGKLEDAMQLVNEHMRVSQQSGNSRALVFSLSALCQILARAVPGSLGLNPMHISSEETESHHYIELHELLKRLDEGSQEENLPELAIFARLLSAELSLAVGRNRNISTDRDRNAHGGAPHDDNEDDRAPCQAASTTLETCMYIKQLACELSTLAAGGPSKLPSSLFAPPKPAGLFHAFAQADARTAMYAQQCTQTANQIRAAGWQVWGSSRLSLETALGVLHSANKNQDGELASLSLILANLYDQYGFRPIERLSRHEKLTSLIRTEISLQRTWDIIQQKIAMHAGRWRDAVDLASRLHIHPKTSEVAHIHCTVESRELTALAYLAGGMYEDADKLAKQGYALAKKASIMTYSLQLLLLRGRIHMEAGSWETASPFFRAVLQQHKQIHADVLGAEAAMYMSQVRMHQSDIDPCLLDMAITDLTTSLPILLAHASLETKAIARIALSNLHIKKAGGHGFIHGSCCTKYITSTIDVATAHRILPLLRDAERDICKLGAKKLKADVLYLASIAYDKLGDLPSRDACAKACLALRTNKTAAPLPHELERQFITTP